MNWEAEDISKATVEREALEAAQAGHTLNDACPYPFTSRLGMHFVAVYLLAKPRTTTPRQDVNP